MVARNWCEQYSTKHARNSAYGMFFRHTYTYVSSTHVHVSPASRAWQREARKASTPTHSGTVKRKTRNQQNPLSFSAVISLSPCPASPSTKTSRSKRSLLKTSCTWVRCTDDVGWYYWFRKVHLIRTRGSTSGTAILHLVTGPKTQRGGAGL